LKLSQKPDRKLEFVPALGNAQIVVGALFHVAGIHRAFTVDIEVGGPVRIECAKNEELLDSGQVGSAHRSAVVRARHPVAVGSFVEALEEINNILVSIINQKLLHQFFI
jgi:hypothetical protein